MNSLVFPNDFEAEKAVLGAVFLDNKMINDVAEILSENSFYSDNHKHIFKAMLELNLAKQPIDEITLGDQLKAFGRIEEVGGYAYLAELVDSTPSSGNIVYYAKIIQEHELLRDLISTTSEIAIRSRDPKQSVNQLLLDAENKIRKIAERRNTGVVKSLKDILVETFDNMEKLSSSKVQPSLMTEFTEIDKLTGGLYPGDLIIVAARPSMGKSSYALNVCTNVGMNPANHVIFYSLEMQNQKNARRILASHGGLNPFFLKTAKTQRDEDWDDLARAADRLSLNNIFFNDRTRQIDDIVNNCHSMKRRFDIKLVVIDYLQKIEGSGEKSREQEVSRISGKLKNLAMDLNIPVIAVCQLNREVERRPDKRPILSDLRDSGSLEQDADVIIFIYRDDYYNQNNSDKPGIAEFILAKVRDGPTGLSELRFDGKHTKFLNR